MRYTRVLWLLVLFPHYSLGQTESSPAVRIAKENLPSVVTLVALDDHDQPLSLGSGFFISTSGIVATNAHVVEGATKVVLKWRGESGTANRILKFDPHFDLVTLQSSYSTTPAVKLGDSDLITIGEEIAALGSPYGLEGTVSTGIISGIRPMDGIKYLQITAPISPGSSGGPVFIANGTVVGVATASLISGQNANFALPTNLLSQIPDSNLSFALAKHLQSLDGTGQNFRDLVFTNNVIENYMGLSDLLSLTLSIQNKTNHTVCDLRMLIIMRNSSGEILNYYLDDLSRLKENSCVPAGLAKQFTISASTAGYRGGKCEIRILDFKVKKDEGDALENLFKKP